MSRVPAWIEAHRKLTQLLRQHKHYGNLVEALVQWRDATSAPPDRLQPRILLVEAYLLTGDVVAARKALPPEGARAGDVKDQLLLDLLRVILALEAKDADEARQLAVRILGSTTKLPPGDVGNPLKTDLLEQASHILGATDVELLNALCAVVTRRANPLEVAELFLDEEEIHGLSDLAAEEGQRALEALRKGEILTFKDLLRTTTSSIGPVASIATLGDAYAGLPRSLQALVLDLLLGALKQGEHVEIRAALGALGQHFSNLDGSAQRRVLQATLALAEVDHGQFREDAVGVLDILYPNLPTAERRAVKQSLEQLRRRGNSPAIEVFFSETVPLVDKDGTT